MIFFRWDLKTPFIKNSEHKSQIQIRGSLYFYLYFPWYIPPNPQIFFYGELKFVFVSCSKGLGIFQISWRPSVLGVLISILGEGARPFSSIRPSMANHVNSKEQLMAKLSASCVHFLFGNFVSIQVSIETLKKVFTTVKPVLKTTSIK